MSVTLISAPANQRENVIHSLFTGGTPLANIAWLPVNLRLPDETFSLRYHDGRYPGLQTVLLGMNDFRTLVKSVHTIIFWQREQKASEVVICICCTRGKHKSVGCVELISKMLHHDQRVFHDRVWHYAYPTRFCRCTVCNRPADDMTNNDIVTKAVQIWSLFPGDNID